MTVILTGSTGSLGAYLLDRLLVNPKVERVICLNRSKDAQQRQIENHLSRGLPTVFDPARVEFWQCDLSAPAFGLKAEDYTHLTSNVTHVLHNAWSVDFNKHLSSFEPNIRGVRRLVELACNSTYDATIFFVSSMSVVANWGTVAGALAKVPETIIEDWRVAKMGYGQSKLVSERLLAEATEVSGIATAICRVGQVAGPVLHGMNGEWNKQEWLPSLIASSKFLRQIPKTLGPVENVDWVPVDWLAQIIVELLPLLSYSRIDSSKKSKNTTAVYHLVNPTSVPWASLLPTVTQHLGPGVATVDFVEWVNKLKESSTKGGSQENPAAKLMPFFDNLQDKAIRFPKSHAATLDTKLTVQCSESMEMLGKVTPEWMELWMKQWAFDR
jgi:thioester reductase-like protein